MDCAAKFEQDVAALPGVTRVQLNFAAAKITIEGKVDGELLVAKGKEHNIAFRPERSLPAQQPFWKANPHAIPTVLAALAVLAGYALSWAGAEVASVAVLLAATLLGGASTFRKGLRNLLRLSFDMNALMTVAVTGAVLIQEWREAAVVAVLFSVSEMLESYTMDRARRSIRQLMEMAPRTARIRRLGGEEEEVPVEDVAIGDTLLVRPGERIAMDGEILSGRSAVNQAAITGESIPVEKGPGDEVFAGTTNGHGALEVRVTRLVEDTTLARLIHLVEEAQAQRAPTQTFVERFARVYTPAVMALAALVMLVPPLLLNQPWHLWIYQGLALLVVACPCALVVSTPVSIVAAISSAARSGVLIKGGAYLEQAGHLRAIAFDKTGTLTRGQPEVTDVAPLHPGQDEASVLTLAAAVEADSEHPLARAIVRRAGTTSVRGREFEALVGRGARAVVEGRTCYVGSPALFTADLGLALPDGAAAAIDRWQGEGKTVMLVGTEAEVLGALAVADTPRESSARTLAALREAGIRHTVMLTGDNAATAQAIGRRVGVDEVRAELLPHQKVEAVREMAAQHGAIGMVGDGVNDAPALAAASVGIAMGGGGTDVALETADIALMADDLEKLPFTIRLSRATLGVIKQNISLALGLKLLAVLAVVPGWLTLWLAILADMGATVLVTLNGMRLLRMKPTR